MNRVTASGIYALAQNVLTPVWTEVEFVICLQLHNHYNRPVSQCSKYPCCICLIVTLPCVWLVSNALGYLADMADCCLLVAIRAFKLSGVFVWMFVAYKWFNNHHHGHLSLNCEGRWGTTDDFTISFLHFLCSLLPSGTWQTPGLSIPWHCLPTSFSVFLVFFPLSLCLAR